MAYKSRKISPKGYPSAYAIKDFICDTPDDIPKLPKFGIEGTQMLNDGEDYATNEPVYYGSSATVIEPYTGYVLSPSNEWKQIF